MDQYWIDKARVKASFDRAATSYDAAAVLQREVRERMLSRLELVKLAPQAILDAGCGTGHASQALAQRFTKSRIVSLDIAMGMLKETRANQPALKRFLGLGRQSLVAGDIEQLPLADSSVELVWSNLAVQWCNDLDAAFSETHRVLKPGGLFSFSTFGPDTLTVVRAGYSAPVLDVERFVLTYDDVLAVMHDLKAIGAHNAAAGRSRGLQGKGFLQKLTDNYEKFRKDGKLPATFEVVYAHAWKPEPKPQLLDGAIPVTFHARK